MIGLYKPVALVVTFCARTSPQEMAGDIFGCSQATMSSAVGSCSALSSATSASAAGPGPAPGNGRAAETLKPVPVELGHAPTHPATTGRLAVIASMLASDSGSNRELWT